MATTPGWYTDPQDSTRARWHDGSAFTEHTVNMADHATPPPPPAPAAWAPAPPPPDPSFPPPVEPSQPRTRQAAKADAAAAQARAKAMRPWFKKKRFVLPLGLVALIVIVSLASSGGSKKNNVTASGGTTVTTVNSVNSGDHAAADDVTLTSCSLDAYQSVNIGVTILNHSSKPSNYLVSINVVDSTGTKIGDGNASTENLAAGQTAKVDGFASASSSTKAPVTCSVASVTRYAS